MKQRRLMQCVRIGAIVMMLGVSACSLFSGEQPLEPPDQWIVTSARMKTEVQKALPWKGVQIGSTSRTQVESQFGQGRKVDATSSEYLIDDIQTIVIYTPDGTVNALKMPAAVEITEQKLLEEYGPPDRERKPGGKVRVVDYDGAGLTVEFPAPTGYARTVELHAPSRVFGEQDPNLIAGMVPIRPPLKDIERRRAEVQRALSESAGRLILVWPDAERAQAQEVAAEISRQGKVIHDENVENYMRGLAARLQTVLPQSAEPWQIAVIDGATANAMSAGGGFIFVTRGCFDQLDNEAQLAFVLAHEMAHQMKRHVAVAETRQMLPAIMTIIGAIAATSSTGSPMMGQAVMEAGQLATRAGMAPFNRAQEQDADTIAMQIVYDAGYDPHQAVAVMEQIKSARDPSGASLSIIASHQTPETRLTFTQQWLAAHQGGESKGAIVNTRDYTAVRSQYRVNRWD